MVHSVEPPPDRQPAAFIVERVGDPGRPRAGLQFSAQGLESLPGQLGLVHGIANAARWLRHGRAHLVEQARRYGPVYKDQFLSTPVVVVSDGEMVAAITRNEDRAWSTALAWRWGFDGIDPTVTFLDLPPMLDFELHKDVRRLMQPAFSGAALASYMAMAMPIIERTLDEWRTRDTVMFKAEVRRLFAKIAGRIFLGVEDDEQAAMLDRALADYWGAPFALVRNRALSPKWRKARRGYRVLHDWLTAQVPARRAGDGTDLFTRMCKTAPDVDWIDDAALVRIVGGVLSAAFDTTASGVASMGYELGRDETWQTRLRAEAQRVATGTATLSDVRQLDETEWVWRETLRMHPVGGHVPRVTLRDVELGTFRIPAGTLVLALLAPAMHDPKVWTEPARFDPERFSPARAEDKRAKGAFLPFGAGAHACIGAQLSTIEAKAFWHVMLTRFRFELARPYTPRHQLKPLGVVTGDVELKLSPL